MTRIPIDSFPKWSREIERIRVLKTTLTGNDISVAAGKNASWWSQTCLNIVPPADWNECEPKIRAVLGRAVVV